MVKFFREISSLTKRFALISFLIITLFCIVGCTIQDEATFFKEEVNAVVYVKKTVTEDGNEVEKIVEEEKIISYASIYSGTLEKDAYESITLSIADVKNVKEQGLNCIMFNVKTNPQKRYKVSLYVVDGNGKSLLGEGTIDSSKAEGDAIGIDFDKKFKGSSIKIIIQVICPEMKANDEMLLYTISDVLIFASGDEQEGLEEPEITEP